MLTLDQLKERQLAISQEAIANPLAPITENIKNKFVDIVNTFSTLLPTQKKEVNSLYIIKLSEAEKKVNQVRTYGYMPLKDLKVPVIEGTFGSPTVVTKTIAEALSLSDELMKATLTPLHDLILSFLGDPSKLSKLDVNEFKKVKLFDDQIDNYKTELKKHINPNKNIQVRPFKEVYDNIEQYGLHFSLCKNQLYPNYVKTAEQRIRIVTKMKEISQSLDLLMLRIEQKPETYNINSFNVNKLAGLVVSVAEVVEFIGSMQVYADMQLGLMMDLLVKVEKAIK